MCEQRPFHDSRELTETADRVWLSLPREDWLEAFRAHPKIGGRRAERETGEEARRWAEEEQKGTRDAARDVLEELAEANREYEQKFGHIFIVCATGKSAAEMLALLRQRLGNDHEAELHVAAEEQRRITQLRLKKSLESGVGVRVKDESPSVWTPDFRLRDSETPDFLMSAITTHVLDISKGRPAGGVPVRLEIKEAAGVWKPLGAGETDADGRLRTLLPEGVALAAATYRLTFETGVYFSAQGVEGFYPEASIVFNVSDAAQHHHVPLLLSPFGYSTYRGS